VCRFTLFVAWIGKGGERKRKGRECENEGIVEKRKGCRYPDLIIIKQVKMAKSGKGTERTGISQTFCFLCQRWRDR
jgi:hypothetical protein